MSVVAKTNARKVWVAWRVDDEVRVQVHRPDVVKAFAKIKTVRPVGYSVNGGYMRLFHIKESVAWVDEWMKNFVRGSSGEPSLN